MFTDVRLAVGPVALACVLNALLPVPAAAEWRRLDSPNFVVIGDLGAGQLREVAVHFEGFRETLSRVLGDRVTATAVPTIVIVFPNDRAFTSYKPLYNGKPTSVVGVFYGGSDVNHITFVRGGDPDSLRIIFHEYAHLVTSNVTRNLPAWLNEGLAEYYSTYEVGRSGKEAMIGRLIESHVRLLRDRGLMPVSKLVAVDRNSFFDNDRNRQSIVYAQSWALTHMLMLGDPPRFKELTAFMRQLDLGVTAGDAWRQAFGDVRIDQELSRHVRHESFKFYTLRFTDKLASFDTASSVMTPADVSAFLAGLYIRQERLDDAEALVSKALAAEPAHPHATVLRARLDVEREKHAAAAERLTALGPADDWYVAYTAGITITDAIEHDRNPAPAQLKAARAHLESVGRHHEVPNALANLAILHTRAPGGAPPDARTAIERARLLAPNRDDYVLFHARVIAEMGEFAQARKILGPMMAPGVPEQIRESARQWMGYIAQLEESRRARRTVDPPPATGAGRPSTPAPDRTPIPIYRVVQADERRMEGLLEGLACPAGAPAVFSVRTDDGAQTFYAPKLADVELITYRDDLTGKMPCGPLKEPMRVYVTWKDEPRGREKRVVAIEFLR